MIAGTPGIWERMPRYVAAWPGIHAMTVTNAMPAGETACQISRHNLQKQVRCVKLHSCSLADDIIATHRVPLHRTESTDSPRLRGDALR